MGMPMGQQQFIIPVEESVRTFDYDEKLPSLPVPSLEQTIQRYLASVKPFAQSEKEFEETKRIAGDFLTGEGADLHSKLKQRADQHRNWLEKWWEDYAYLMVREALVPHCSMAGAHPSVPGYRYGPGQQIKIAAAYCCEAVHMWELLRAERLMPQVASDKRPLSMHQFRRLFNCSVIPGLEKDTINAFFKTEREGPCPSHVAVVCNGHVFTMEAVRPDGQPLAESEWRHQLTDVQKRATEHRGADIPQLSCDQRTNWAKNRQHLIELSPVNAAILSLLDTAMFVLCLDDESPSLETARCHSVLGGDYACRWPDAASSLIVFSNGLSAGLCLHSAFDGMVSGTGTLFTFAGVMERAKQTRDESVASDLPGPRACDFVVDTHILAEIKKLKTEHEKEKKKITICEYQFTHFGKNRIKDLKVHPDSFIQMAIQLGYFRLHSKIGPCYETATTRGFYHGRTETVRSCSAECVAWVKSMVNPQVKDSERAKLLLTAVQKHNQLMKEACAGAGCDRHLLGLYCTAVEEGRPVPRLFQDPLFTKSGGNGNFTLSTSLLGYMPLSGAVSPMTVDGYGIFYSIVPKGMVFTVSARTDSSETDVDKFYESINKSVRDMASLLDSQLSEI